MSSSQIDQSLEAAYAKLLPDFKQGAHLKLTEILIKKLPTEFVSQEGNHITLIYFVLGAISLLNPAAAAAHFTQYIDPKALADYIYSLQVLPTEASPAQNCRNCGFQGTQESLSPASRYRMASIANTYAALCVLRMIGDDYSRVDRQALAAALRANQQPSGVFPNAPLVPDPEFAEHYASWSETGECDLRFVFSACAISAMIGDWSGIDKERAIDYILKCRGFEGGGFAQNPGLESHGGSTYCAVNALALMGALDRIPNKDRLVRWLLERQVTGFQGRINKDPDSCYAFWIGASLKALGKFDLVDKETLVGFLLSCQTSLGGFSKIPGVYPDPLHTYMSLCGLSFVF